MYLEYKIKDAVVVHNDVAELYWCFLENNDSEIISDYKIILHLPKEDENLMLWSHGPETGKCEIIDKKTVTLNDSEIRPHKHETLRIMFNKELVPNAIKFSNIDGKDNILKYENAISNSENPGEEYMKVVTENELSDAFVRLNEKPSIFLYKRENEIIEEITWDDTLK